MTDPQSSPNATSSRKPKKLPKLPDYVRVSKRPLLHPAIPTPFTSSAFQKVVYVKHKTPFIPIIKRVRHLLSKAEDRDTQSLLPRKTPLDAKTIEAAIAEGQGEKKGKREEIFVKASGRAIERALQVALFFQQQSDCRVRISTGTADAIDDIIVKLTKGEISLPSDGKDSAQNNKNRQNQGHKRKRADEKEVELPEARIRHTNVIEVAISLR
ncbi:hypothetical protein AOQ84DRAFT_359066 [Glonium stellatum]|uniref:Uncharacterized protein n=1 Tax=Glonium stellatum TaxID=574774 RepID=A0A8E2FC39_9PEZI|nr:hypothetical protein AOQ84DRAFT_359066 [Glonium stellatum]